MWHPLSANISINLADSCGRSVAIVRSRTQATEFSSPPIATLPDGRYMTSAIEMADTETAQQEHCDVQAQCWRSYGLNSTYVHTDTFRSSLLCLGTVHGLNVYEPKNSNNFTTPGTLIACRYSLHSTRMPTAVDWATLSMALLLI
jgi:hypothetical protein